MWEDELVRIKVLLVDDHPLVRTGLRTLLTKDPSIEVVAEADNGEDAIRLAMEISPDVVVLDISMPKPDGLETLRIMKSQRPNMAVLVLTVHDDYEHVIQVIDYGGAGFLTKDAMGEQIVQAVKAVASGDAVFSQPVLRKILGRKSYQSTDNSQSLSPLTTREMMVLKLAARGLSNAEIAARLVVTTRTVRGHLEDLFDRLNVASRTEAIATALRRGLIGLHDLE